VSFAYERVNDKASRVGVSNKSAKRKRIKSVRKK
jgi:hypothetical protein